MYDVSQVDCRHIIKMQIFIYWGGWLVASTEAGHNLLIAYEKLERERKRVGDVRMAEAAVRFLLENLRDVVDEHIDLIRGVEGEVKKLQKEFEQLKPLLRNLQECPDLDREIRGLVYGAEDIIDTILTRPVAKSLPRFLPKNWYPDFGHRSTTISDLETLTNDVRKAVTKAPDAEIRKAVKKAPDAQKQQLHGITYQKVGSHYQLKFPVLSVLTHWKIIVYMKVEMTSL